MIRINKADLRIKKDLWKKSLHRDWQLYLLLTIPLALVIFFSYAAYPGLRMVFMDYKPARGYAGSDWVGLDTFVKIFQDKDFIRALKSSIAFNLLDLAMGFPVPILLALMLNELRFIRFKRIAQTVLYLPHFLSWVIIGAVSYTMFRTSTGLVNILFDTNIPYLTEKWHWGITYLLTGVWQSMGWGSIIYLAAITSINNEIYEAAMIDGVSNIQKIFYVTLPCIRSTVITMLIINLGRIMGSNFERLTAFGNSQVKDFQYQLAIYIYEKGLAGANFSKATAVGLFQSLIGLLLVLLADRIAKKLGENGLL